MSLRLTTHGKGDVSIVDVSGRLALGEGTIALRKMIWELAERGSRRVVLNLADATYIDSTGIGELVAAYTTVTTAGGEMKLLNLDQRAHELLNITRLYTVFETFEDEASAIGSFPADKPSELMAQI